jgi:hypothetical protein
MRVWAITLLALLIAGDGEVARAAPRFVESPQAVDEITRGIEDGLHCGLGYTTAAHISNCAVHMSGGNLRLSSDYPAYNTGLFFEVWRDLDVDWTSDGPLLASHQISAADVQNDENATKAIYVLYRDARDRLGISDKDLLALTKLTPAGKSHTWDRLQFWAKQVR